MQPAVGYDIAVSRRVAPEVMQSAMLMR